MSNEPLETKQPPEQDNVPVPTYDTLGAQFDVKSLLFFAVVAAVIIIGAIVLESRM
ncbi:MAG TPA: hypothetical protein VGK67_05375 [Myxococcales bacterium]|jgi:hypothetical protein